MPTFDSDVPQPEAANAIEQLIRGRFEDHGRILIRFGAAPKFAIPFRTNTPYKKIVTCLVSPAGSEVKIELLADGQHVVCFGVHPGTGKLYGWHGGQPGEVKLADLPYLSEDDARALVNDAAELLIAEHGFSRPARVKANGLGHHHDRDWTGLLSDISAGRSLHESTCTLTAKLVRGGLEAGATVNLTRALLEGSAAPRDNRFADRLADVPRLVTDAQNKFAAPAAALGIFSAADARVPPPRGWLLGNTFCRRLTSSLLASGGTGKTALRTVQAMALATGRPISGEHVFQRTRVLLVSLEDDLDELRRRVLAARLHHNIPAAELDGWLFLTAPGGNAGKLMTTDRRTGAIVVGGLAASIEAAIIAHGIGLIIIDPLIKAHGVNENSNSEMDALAGLLTDLAAKHNLAIDLPHHVGKGPADPGNADRGRGASSTAGAYRLVFTLSTMTLEEAQRFSIPEDDRRGYIRLDRAKVNPARSARPAAWFRLVGVSIGNATANYPAGDEVQTVECWTPPETWSGLDATLLNRILTAIGEGPGGGNFYTHAGAATDRAAWEVVCRFAPHKSEAQAREIIAAWVKSGLLIKFDYTNPATRRTVKGLKVDDAKRPS